MKKLNSGTRPFATKIVTSLRDGNIEYVANMDTVREVRANLNPTEEVVCFKEDCVYKLQMKGKVKRAYH